MNVNTTAGVVSPYLAASSRTDAAGVVPGVCDADAALHDAEAIDHLQVSGAEADSTVHLEHPWLTVGLSLLALGGVVPAHAAAAAPSPATDALVRTLPSLGLEGGGHATGPVTTGHSTPTASPASQTKAAHQDTQAKGDGTLVSLDQTNDSMPSFGQIPSKDRTPGTNLGDDDGWTAGIHASVVTTHGNSQWVTSAGYDMVTQRGSWIPNNPEYKGLRNDLAQVAVQHNTRTELGDKVTLDYGVGGGVQAVGPMGGLGLQLGVHDLGRGTIFEGRHSAAEGLQTHYTSDQVRVAPIVTAGVGLTENLDSEGHYKLAQSVQGIGVLGEGVSVARARVGIEAEPVRNLNVAAGVRVDAVHNSDPNLNYMKMNGVRPGWDASVEYDGFKHVHPFVEMTGGGMRDEPNYAVGFSVPFGGSHHAEHARINPIFK